MKAGRRYAAGLGLFVAIVLGTLYAVSSTTSAQPAGAAPMDPAGAVAQSIATKTVTLTIDKQKGEPRLITGKAMFDKPVQAYWVSLVGADIRFADGKEKYINRSMFSVDPFAKIINGKEVEVSGKLGIRDGSGDFDEYEGTLTVSVTAILGS